MEARERLARRRREMAGRAVSRPSTPCKPGPCAARLAAESDKFPEEIRELLYGRGGKRRHKHRILFTIREDTVHILYIRHTARDELEP